MFRGHSAQREALVQALAIAARRRMPLSPTLEAFSEQCGFIFRNRILTLADALQIGLPLPEALDRVPGVLPADAEVMIRVGWDVGIPVEALQEAAARRSSPPPWVNLTGQITYVLFVLLAIQTLVGFIMYFIAPKLEAIFADFGLPLPPVTLIVLQMNFVGFNYRYFAGLMIAVELFLLVSLPLTAGGRLSGWIPLFDRLFLRRHSAVILRSLARVVECDKPLPKAIAVLARRYPATWVHVRLRGVALDIDRGRDWCESLYYHSLISATGRRPARRGAAGGKPSVGPPRDRRHRRAAARVPPPGLDPAPLSDLDSGPRCTGPHDRHGLLRSLDCTDPEVGGMIFKATPRLGRSSTARVHPRRDRHRGLPAGDRHDPHRPGRGLARFRTTSV